MEITDQIISYTKILFFSGGLIFIYKSIYKLINDDIDRIRLFYIIDEQKWWAVYAKFLDSLDVLINLIFGKSLIGGKSFFTSLRIAWVYPYIIIFTISGVRDLSLDSNVQKLGYIIICVILSVISIKLSNKIHSIKEKIEFGRFWSFFALDCLVFPVVYIIFVPVISIIATLLSYLIFGENMTVPVIITSFIILSIGSIFSIIYAAIAFSIAFSIIGFSDLFAAFSLLDQSSGGEGISKFLQNAGLILIAIFVFLLFCIFPIINSIFDFMSWTASRFLIRRIVKDAENHSWIGIISHIVIDIILACIFLIATTYTIVYFINTVAISDADRQDWSLMIENPFLSSALVITLMSASAIIPTLLHLTIAVLAFISQYAPKKKYILSLLESTSLSFYEKNVVTVWMIVSFSLSFGLVIFFIFSVIYALEANMHFSIMSGIYQIGKNIDLMFMQ